MRRLIIGILVTAVSTASGQSPADSSSALQDSAPRVFFDCPMYLPGCDFDFVRTEITWVNWVRNREDADVHVLITTQPTGGGGSEYTLALIGLRAFAGTVDTLRYYSGGTNTRDETRTGLVGVLKLALVRYAARTPLAGRLTVTYAAPAAAAAQSTHDPWNAWVFTVQGSAFLNGQSQIHSSQFNGSLEANRTTDRWKLSYSISESYNEDVFKDVPYQFDSLGNPTATHDVHSISRRYGGDLLTVRSLGTHWSAGLRGSFTHSTFSNLDVSLSLGPAIEYNIYPYAQSTRRQFTLQYSISPQYYNYTDTTIYGKLTEKLVTQSVTAALGVTQPWGSANLSLTGSHYLNDFHQNRLVLFGGVNLRVIKGLSLGISGSVERIHDQRSLSLVGATPDQILLQRRELATSYSYFSFISLSYHFGSTLNNVVNPRFGNSGGGMIMIM
jgi:hypothetical protein